MASEKHTRRVYRQIVMAVLLISGASALGGAFLDAPRVLTIAMLMMLSGVIVAYSSLIKLAVPAPLLISDPPIGIPRGAADQLEELRRLDSLLEHAPIAFFSIRNDAALPVNARARRIVAPGRVHPPDAFYATLQAAAPTSQTLISFESERGIERALYAATDLNIAGKRERLIALMPVESELEAEALHAWQQLVHVLTHEIMNSLTPVASLSRTAVDLLTVLDSEPEAHEDLVTALTAISRRADSLAGFVASYRSLSALPEPRPERIEIAVLFAQLSALILPEWRAASGNAQFRVEPATVELVADPGQLEQAIINLACNALEACQGVESPQLLISAQLSRGGRLRIEISDNGPGVPDQIASQIFTPFFSTKSKGRGIGLALVRQLIHGNNGTVRLAKSISGGARFILTF